MNKLSALVLSFLLTPVGSALAQFIIPQGPLTVTAITAVYIKDLDLNLSASQVQDMGAWYTQKQLNESGDLKHAYQHGKISFALAGTTPGSVVASLGAVTALSFVVPQGPLLLTAPAGPSGVYIKDLDLEIPAGSSQDMGELYTQNQLNTSNDLKSAILFGSIIVGAGTVTPIPDPFEVAGLTSTLAGKVDRAGDTMTGDLAMSGKDILSVGSFTASGIVTGSTFNAVGSAYLMNGVTVIDGNRDGFFENITATTIEDTSGVSLADLDASTQSLRTDVDAKIPLSQKGVANGVPTLDGSGFVPQAQLPAVAITTTTVVAGSVTGTGFTDCDELSNALQGDVCVAQTDSKSYILLNNSPLVAANWTELLSPPGTTINVSGTAPISSSGGPSPVISINPATTITAGSMSSADKVKLNATVTGTHSTPNDDSADSTHSADILINAVDISTTGLAVEANASAITGKVSKTGDTMTGTLITPKIDVTTISYIEGGTQRAFSSIVEIPGRSRITSRFDLTGPVGTTGRFGHYIQPLNISSTNFQGRAGYALLGCDPNNFDCSDAGFGEVRLDMRSSARNLKIATQNTAFGTDGTRCGPILFLPNFNGDTSLLLDDCENGFNESRFTHKADRHEFMNEAGTMVAAFDGVGTPILFMEGNDISGLKDYDSVSDQFTDIAVSTNSLQSGKVSIAGDTMTGSLTLSSGDFAVASPTVPSTAADACTAGTLAWDASYLYMCTASGVWKRSPLTTW